MKDLKELLDELGNVFMEKDKIIESQKNLIESLKKDLKDANVERAMAQASNREAEGKLGKLKKLLRGGLDE